MLLQSNLHSKKVVFSVIGNEAKLITKLVLSAQGPFKAGLHFDCNKEWSLHSLSPWLR